MTLALNYGIYSPKPEFCIFLIPTDIPDKHAQLAHSFAAISIEDTG